MIHFDAVDFSGRRSEEVINFFWRSVYIGFGYFGCCIILVFMSFISLLVIVFIHNAMLIL